MIHPKPLQEDFYQQLLAELTEREGGSLAHPPEAANDAHFDSASRPRRRYGALAALLLAVATAIVVGASPLTVVGALALMAVLATPLLAVELGSARLFGAAVAGGALATAAAYGLSPVGAAAAVVASAALLGVLFRREPAKA